MYRSVTSWSSLCMLAVHTFNNVCSAPRIGNQMAHACLPGEAVTIFRYQKDGSCHPGGTRPRQSTWNNLCGATRFILRVVLAAPPNAGGVDVLVFEQPNSVYTLGMNARPMPCGSASFHCMTFRLMQLYRGSRKVDRPQRGTRSSITLVAFIVDLSTVHTVNRSGTPSIGEDEGSWLTPLTQSREGEPHLWDTYTLITGYQPYSLSAYEPWISCSRSLLRLFNKARAIPEAPRLSLDPCPVGQCARGKRGRPLVHTVGLPTPCQ